MTCYSISQPYNVYSHNKDEPRFSDLKSVLVPDKSDNKSCLDKDCITVQKLCLIGDHHIPNLHTFLKHHHVPFHGDHNPHFKHYYSPYHNPCYNSQHEAAWYHAHDSGNTVVLNVPPYWDWGWGTGTRWTGATGVARAEGAPIGHSEPVAATDPATEII